MYYTASRTRHRTLNIVSSFTYRTVCRFSFLTNTMPLPKEALTILGGCNCRNITYRIKVPALKDRPLHPNYDTSSKLPPVYQPFVFTDHCNDCRRATGSILPAWISGPLEYFSVSFGPPRQGESDDSREWIPAQEVFKGRNELNEGKLGIYISSPGRHRYFCLICGTNLAYWEEQLPSMLDVLLGTVDAEYLKTEALRPERHLWWNLGISWMREYLDSGDGGQGERHVDANMNERYPLREPGKSTLKRMGEAAIRMTTGAE